jgi:hypothetical protein
MHPITRNFDILTIFVSMQKEKGGAMKNRGLVVVAITFLVLLGCDSVETIDKPKGTVKFSILDEIEDAQKTIEYGQDPVIPGDIGTFSYTTPPDSIDFSSEVMDLDGIESIEMSIHIDFDNDTGTLDFTYTAYLAALDEDPFSTTPIISETVSLDGDNTVTSEILVESDQRLVDLCNGGLMQYAAQISGVVEDGSQDVTGRAKLTLFDLTVVYAL